ncbi:nicotinate-nucleotide--dimethylbenzimidazole phosphoribosyltransferase [Ornithinimicrobium sp. INDO-MA30-4]|uniref:nicotinate-nucleotide--dimethylbenzimidazole phosphoribosyltransferase n=1 Tax=Ornithinimicrobium sp. INDO-MA30-4 TaxID=2908651 RepID=UPI0037C69141
MTLALSDQDRAWLDELAASIYLVNGLARQRAEERQQTLIKPPGSLGELETISVRLAAILGSERPAPDGATVIVAAADHGVSADGVSAFPAAVTAAMIQGLLAPTAAGTGVRRLARLPDQCGLTSPSWTAASTPNCLIIHSCARSRFAEAQTICVLGPRCQARKQSR